MSLSFFFGKTTKGQAVRVCSPSTHFMLENSRAVFFFSLHFLDVAPLECLVGPMGSNEAMVSRDLSKYLATSK
jgi:hypothetical protein